MGRFGQFVSKVGAGVKKVGGLASKIGNSKVWGQLAPVVKTLSTGIGIALDGETLGESGKIASSFNKAIDFTTDGRLAKAGGIISAVGGGLETVGGGGAPAPTYASSSMPMPRIASTPVATSTYYNPRHHSRM